MLLPPFYMKGWIIVRIVLNVARRDNYMFMDRESRLFLNLGNPVGIIEKPSQAVLRGIKYDTLIDIDEVTGVQISPEHKAVHDKVIKKLGLARLDKKADAAAKADMAKEGKAAIEQLVEAATESAKETKSKKSKAKKESEQ